MKLQIAGPAYLHEFTTESLEWFVADEDEDAEGIPCAVTLAARDRMWLERIPVPESEPCFDVANDNGAELARKVG